MKSKPACARSNRSMSFRDNLLDEAILPLTFTRSSIPFRFSNEALHPLPRLSPYLNLVCDIL